MDLDVTSALREVLEAHWLSPKPQAQELAVGKMTITAWVFRRPSATLTNLFELDVRVRSHLIADRILIESFAGWGQSEPEALKQAWEKFCRSSLHVLLEVFIDQRRGEDQVAWETWGNGSFRWRVAVGPLFVSAFGDQPLPNLACGDLLDKLRDHLLPTLGGEYHWLRFYGSARESDEACILSDFL